LADGLGAGDDRTVPRGQQHPHRLPVAAGPGRGQVLAGQRLAGGPHGVQVVALGAVAAGRTGRSVDLDHPLTAFEQERGQPGAVAAGAFDRPYPPAGCVLAGEGEQPLVAHRVGGALHRVDHAAGGGLDDGGGVGVAVGVDPDDVVDLACEHGSHGVPPDGGMPMVGTGLGAVTARQDCDEARPCGRPGF
jgi:hypothetical protein